MATVADFSRITAHLEAVEVGDRVSSFMESHQDAFLAWSQDESFESAGGSKFVSKLLTRGTAGANPDYSLNAMGAPGRHRIELNPVNLEWRAEISRDAMLGAMEKGASFAFDLVKEEVDARKHFALLTLGRTLAGTGWGELAGINNIASTVVTVAHPDQNAAGATVAGYINRFYPGQLCGSCDILASGDLRGTTPGSFYTVSSTDPSAGTVTFTGAVTDMVDGDILVEKGFRPFSASSGKRCVEGIASWMSSGAIGGLTRSTNAGTYPMTYDATSDASVVDALIAADSRAGAYGLSKRGLACLVSMDDFRKLQQSNEAKVHVEKVGKQKGDGSTYTISFSQFELTGARGLIPVAPSMWVPNGQAIIGPFQDKELGFRLGYAGKSLTNLTKEGDGNAIRLAPAGITDNSGNTVAGYIVEGYSRVQLFCGAPGHYMVVNNLPTE